MDKLLLDLENCYGIKKLSAELDFTQTGVVAIYAPNGAMKTSFAETFRDIAGGRQTKDRIFSSRSTKRVVRDEAGNELSADSVVVVKSYDDVLPNEKLSTLLVNSALRVEYEKLIKGVSESKDRLIKALRAVSGSKNIERAVSSTFTSSDNAFIQALARVSGEVAKQSDAPFASVKYDLIFDEKTLGVISARDFKQALEAYVKSYNALLDKSQYFKRGIFNYYNASTIARSLAENGFFKAKHVVRLNGSEEREIADVSELEQIIQQERDSITNDPDLKQKYDAIEKALNKNADLRTLHAFLSENEHVLPYLADIEGFRELVIKSYLKVCFEQVQELISLAEATDESKRGLEEAAAKERTEWENVIDVFNDRFSVPFRLEVKNLVPVILGMDKLPTLGFTFHDGNEAASIERDNLLTSLSMGEKKAFYILNVLFDMQVRMRSGQPSLFVIDDIADSFDYKNKYAIIEYLKDAADHDNFRQILLTHNFDFFRTACSRIMKGRDACFMAVKTQDGITLQKAYGVKNVFDHWKNNYHSNRVIKIATIPFIRNIAEYTQGQSSAPYVLMTKMLHIKPDSGTLTVGDLDAQFNSILSKNVVDADPGRNLMAFIHEVAAECLAAPESVNFENKIVLSIAIRLAAEEFMISRINDPAAVEAIKGNQTAGLYDLYKVKFHDDADGNALMRQVLLMTPEAIHLNSFMYEPIVDMSDEHLRRLYRKLKPEPKKVAEAETA